MKTLNTTIITVLMLILSAGTLATGTVSAADTANANNPAEAIAENDYQLFDKLERSLLYGLQSEHTGVVESVLFNAIEYKTLHPEFESDAVEEKLVKTINLGATHTIRYKAYLALSYYRNQDIFGPNEDVEVVLKTKDQNGFFRFIDDVIKYDQLTAR